MFSVTPGQRLILASASPRRKELLSGIGLKFEISVSNCDETVLEGESPQKMVERLAVGKATAVSASNPDAWILGADTTVVVGGTILGKPNDKADAAVMLSQIQGTRHTVWGAFSLLNLTKRCEVVFSSSSQVQMKPMSKQMIESYIATGEPMDKAGSYAIQGIGASLVQSVTGSYTNVVGLDLALVVDQMLALEIIRST